MTNADMSPEEGAQRRHRACEEDGDCFVHLRACLSSFMHDRITGKPFLDDEPVLICTKVIAFRLVAATSVRLLYDIPGYDVRVPVLFLPTH